MKINNESRILITGGTGSFGKAFIKDLLENFPEINRLVIFSRDELKQWEMQQQYPVEKFPNLRFFLGDVRDNNRLRKAFEGIDIVVHAAALKQVPAAEYNPTEYIKHNNAIPIGYHFITCCFTFSILLSFFSYAAGDGSPE